MLDMGFRPQVEKILRSVPKERQTMLFSATLDGEVGELADSYTDDPARFEALREISNDDGVILHHFVSVTPDGKVDTLVELLGAERRALARLRPHEARRRPPRAEACARAASTSSPCTATWASRSANAPSSGSAGPLHHPDCHRRGCSRSRPRRHRPRHQFRPARGRQGLRAPRRRTGRAGRSGRGSTLVLPDQQADVSRVAARLGHKEQFERTGMRSARPKLVYTSRRGRRSRW